MYCLSRAFCSCLHLKDSSKITPTEVSSFQQLLTGLFALTRLHLYLGSTDPDLISRVHEARSGLDTVHGVHGDVTLGSWITERVKEAKMRRTRIICLPPCLGTSLVGKACKCLCNSGAGCQASSCPSTAENAGKTCLWAEDPFIYPCSLTQFFAFCLKLS